MKYKKKIMNVTISILILATILLVGLSYAYYRTRVIGNESEKSISITSEKLEIVYSEDTAMIEANGIQPGDSFIKTFSVTNTGTESVSFSIILDNMINSYQRTEDWTYILKADNEVIKSGEVPKTDGYLLNSTSIDVDQKISYTLTIIYADSKENQSIDMGKELIFRVNIGEEANVWENPKEGTLLYAIKKDNEVKEPTTLFGQPTGEEAILATAQDDYGTSYYFRGNVKNNFVTFSGMCFRIVRVQGDGTIKLVLADEDHVCGPNVQVNTDGTYSGYSTENESGAFIGDAKTQSFKYQTEYLWENISDINENDFIFETSDIPPVLDAWVNGGNYVYDSLTEEGLTGSFSQHISDNDLEKLANTVWCNDMSYTVEKITNTDGTESGFFKNNYGAQKRLVMSDPVNPTLKCDMTGENGSRALKYVSNVGLLTIDEAVYAGSGAERGVTYNNYYLVTNASELGLGYFTMSPRIAHYSLVPSLNIATVSDEGKTDAVSINYGSTATISATIRPSIVLKSDVTISSGNGEQATPYVIN